MCALSSKHALRNVQLSIGKMVLIFQCRWSSGKTLLYIVNSQEVNILNFINMSTHSTFVRAPCFSQDFSSLDSSASVNLDC